MYYKDEFHEKEMFMMLNKFGLSDVYSDVEYGSFSYIVSAIGKGEDIIKCFDESNSIDLNMFDKTISVYSGSEKDMSNFALQCFNKHLSDITLADTFRSLDSKNEKVIKQAIEIRY